MYTLLVTLHVLAAVLIIGPFALAGFAGHRAIRRNDARGTRDAARFMARFGIGTLLVALLGVGALSLSNRYTFRTPWVIISMTLYVVAMGVATGYTVPTMRRAATLVDAALRPAPAAVEGTAEVTQGDQAIQGDQATRASQVTPATQAAQVTDATGAGQADLVARERLNGFAGRVIGSGVLVLLLMVAITVLMVTRPFGR